jgi:hypothetical protein
MDDPALTWADRWRAVRGSPPGRPGDDGFGLLAEMPPDAIDEIAAGGEDKDMLSWWREIATDPARAELAALRPLQVDVYRALRDHGPVTDDVLAGLMQRGIRRVSPRRNDLTKLGLVHWVGRTDPADGTPAKLWAIVPHDEIVKARHAAAKRGRRRKRLDTYTLDERLQLVRSLMRMPDVNQALLDDHSKTAGAKHARREARAAQQEAERERRELNDHIKQAERHASPDLNFLKAKRQMRSAVDAIRELGRVLGENLDSVELNGMPLIHPDHWPEARALLRELIIEAQDIDDDLTGLIGDEDVDDDLIIVEAIDHDRELAPGEEDE